jgi:hypothetical protein
VDISTVEEDGIILDHPMQEIVLVNKDNHVIDDHLEHEGKIVVPKDIEVIVEPIPKNKTKQIDSSEPVETNEYAMSISQYQQEYNTISAEEAYSVAKFGNYMMLAGILTMGAISYKVVPAILRRIGFRRRGRLRVYSDDPELTRTNMARQNIIHEEHDIYTTPKRRIPKNKPRYTPHLKTP